MATTTRQLADFLLEGGVQDIAVQQNPHIQPGVLQPAVAGKLLDGTTNHSGAYGTAQSDGHSYYYTDIKGSKPIKDPRIGAHFGSQRHDIRSLQRLEQETATHGLEVCSVDGREWFRTVGIQTDWLTNDSNGIYTFMNATSHFFEITGYFNGFNMKVRSDNETKTAQVHVDGVQAHSAHAHSASTATPLGGRYVDRNGLVNVDLTSASSLSSDTTLGIHTIKITRVAGGLYFSSIELIAQDTTSTANRSKIQIPSQNVVSYGKKFTVSGTPHYDPFNGFTNGTTLHSANVDTATSLGLGTASTWGAPWAISSSNHIRPFNGGRVVKWVDSSGTIKTSVTMMPRNAQNMGPTASNEITPASATNTHTINFSDDAVENSLSEVAKTYLPFEFGNGSANGGPGGTWKDLSTLDDAGNTHVAYVMDDGLTSLSGEDVRRGSSDKIVFTTGTSDYWYLTFIGTGITLGARNANVQGTRETIAQNLPYGTHVLKMESDASTHQTTKISVDGILVKTTSGNNNFEYGGFYEITFHQPKMPPIPEEACIIADYMLMADHVQNTSATVGTMSKGVRRIGGSRDHFYDCAGAIVAMNAGSFTNPFYWYGPGSHSGNIMTASIPYFGTSFTSFAEDKDRAGYGHTLDGSSVTVTTANSDETRADLFYYSVSTLGQHTKVCILPAGGYRFCATDVATPIHTSSHYQTFESPYQHELVGGDRNMEQTNLVVTPDGKTWDEVRRDTSYIGKQDVVARCTSTSNVARTVNSTEKFNEIRGVQHKSKCGNKNWVLSWNRWICLVDGNYHIEYYSLLEGSNKSTYQLRIEFNGHQVANSWMDGTSYESGRSFFTTHCIRGDYISVFGAVWDHDNSSFVITKV